MVTRTELTQRVEVLEQKILAQTNLTDRVVALELELSNANKLLQTTTVTITILCKAVADLQKEVECCKNSPQLTEKKEKTRNMR